MRLLWVVITIETDEIPPPQWKAKLKILTLYDIIGLESINKINT